MILQKRFPFQTYCSKNILTLKAFNKYIFQAQYHVARARKIDEEERIMRKKQQDEREKLKRMQLDMQREVEERRRVQKEEAAKARQEYLEKMKNATIIEAIDDKPAKKGCKFLGFAFRECFLRNVEGLCLTPYL